jgi:hypothetical protein
MEGNEMSNQQPSGVSGYSGHNSTGQGGYSGGSLASTIHFTQVTAYLKSDLEEMIKPVHHSIGAGPLLLRVMSGIDMLGGILCGYQSRSHCRSARFMVDYLRLDGDFASMLYSFVRCGLAHEGTTKCGVSFALGPRPNANRGFGWYEPFSWGTDAEGDFIHIDVLTLAQKLLDALSSFTDTGHTPITPSNFNRSFEFLKASFPRT